MEKVQEGNRQEYLTTTEYGHDSIFGFKTDDEVYNTVVETKMKC